ncbi:hypothetical protein GCM10010515_74070 [Streptomyces fructofermentans]|uniref:Uncharacterized protein n=1 Tax=Streptomyces fructofermentans TaxID=152141 RepID=A0A918NU98_9ACTN|nr:hypothetical protein GCM10010515_74070 [Streptomyces fructofermentans]
MGAFNDCSNLGPGAQSASHAEDACAWCVQLRETDVQSLSDAGRGQAFARALESLAGACPGIPRKSSGGVVRTVLVVLAAATIITATVSAVLDTRP